MIYRIKQQGLTLLFLCPFYIKIIVGGIYEKKKKNQKEYLKYIISNIYLNIYLFI
jgi:hypothetical protein